MNVESANVLPLLSSSSAVEGASLPLAEDGAVSQGFSEALLAQIESLAGVKEGGQLPLSAQALTDSQGNNLQDIAALSGKDLPVTDANVVNADNLSATLDAVTGTLKYISAGRTAEEKAAQAEQNIKDVIALAGEAGQNMKGVAALAGETEKSMKDVVTLAGESEKNMKNGGALVNEATQNLKDAAAINDAPVQMDASLANGDLDKEAKNKGQDQITSAEDVSVQEEPAAVVLPSVVLTQQGRIDDKAAQDNAAKEKILSSFVKPLTDATNLNLFRKGEVSGDASQQEVGSRQATQDKLGFNLKYFENTGQAEKTGLIERPAFRLDEGDKILPRVAGEIAQLNRSAADNKAEVPALAKPLSHPEWNKDLGDRIMWMNNRTIPAAEIKMNPQHLGPISVRIDVNQEHQANIVFTAQHAVVREAIEASIPKLREMMSAQQLNLVDVNVSQNSTSGQGQPQPQSFAQMTGGHGNATENIASDGISDVIGEVENEQAMISKGLLSIYA